MRRLDHRHVATLHLNAGEVLWIGVDYDTDSITFRFGDGLGDSFLLGDAFSVAMARARELGDSVRGAGGSFSLNAGGEMMLSPVQESGALSVLFVTDDGLSRAATLLRGARRRLAAAIDQARASGLDPSLVLEAAARARATT